MSMLSFLIIIVLLLAFGKGWRLGFTRQLILAIGSLAVFFIAWRYNADLSRVLGQVITTFKSNYTTSHFTNILSFYILIFIGNAVIFALAKASKAVTWLPVIKQTNALAGALLATLLSYVAIFIVLWTFAILPFQNLNTFVAHSEVAQWITQQTPLLTERLIDQLFGLS